MWINMKSAKGITELQLWCSFSVHLFIREYVTFINYDWNLLINMLLNGWFTFQTCISMSLSCCVFVLQFKFYWLPYALQCPVKCFLWLSNDIKKNTTKIYIYKKKVFTSTEVKKQHRWTKEHGIHDECRHCLSKTTWSNMT